MSARLERLRRSIDAFNRGDFDALRELASDSVELRSLTSAELVRGKDAVIEWFRPDAFDEQAVEIRELREEGERVFAEFEVYGRGAASGIEVRQPGYVVYEFEDDLVVRLSSYPTRELALDAAGIEGG